jgi:hypothetical protein
MYYLVYRMSSSVRKCDIDPPQPARNPSNYVPVHNEDCGIASQALLKDDSEDLILLRRVKDIVRLF